MNDVKQTPSTPKPTASKGKKILSIVVVLAILAAGGATAYYLLKTDKKPSTNTPAAQATEKTSAELAAALPTRQEIEERYATAKQALQDTTGKTDQERGVMYATAAFLAASLNDDQAKTYASEALKLLPTADFPKDAPVELKNYRDNLTKISQGDYSTVGKAPDDK